MILTSVNIGTSRLINYGNQQEPTGIFKEPAPSVFIDTLGLTGDYIDDKKHHGGPDQAVYLYGTADYAWWEAQIGRAIAPGTFGENLTISDLVSTDIVIGDRFAVGGAILEAAAPRVPCATLAARMDDPQFVRKFRNAVRPGVYCRVIQTGSVTVGDAVTYIPFAGEPRVTISTLFNDWYEKEATEDDLRCYLAAPIGIRLRHSLEKRIAELMP